MDDALASTNDDPLLGWDDVQLRTGHLHPYVFAAQFVAGKRVLDAGCGDGAGAAIRARTARHVVGLDRDAVTLDQARRRYGSDRLHFVRADATRLPLVLGSVDVAVDFETFARVVDRDGVLTALKMTLRAEGLLVLSFSDSDLRSPADRADDRQSFPQRERAVQDVLDLLGRHFRHVEPRVQSVFANSIIAPDLGPGAEGAPPASPSAWEPRPYLILCADVLPPNPPPSLLHDDGEHLLRQLLAAQRFQEQTIAALTSDRQLLEQTLSWRTALFLQKARRRLAPSASARERLWRRVTRLILSSIGHHTDPYQRWLATHEPSAAATAAARRRVRPPVGSPLSLVLPVPEVAPAVLHGAIDAIRAQTSDAWQLCLGVAATSPALRAAAEAVAASDPRIRVAVVAGAADPVQVANAAADLATGDALMMIDLDDRLAPDAVLEIGAALLHHPAGDLYYVDEDRLTEDGGRRDPFFKPEWSPELLLSVNYLPPLIVRRRLFVEIGGFRPAALGATQRQVPIVGAERAGGAIHVPRVLCHRLDSDRPMPPADRPDPREVRRRCLAAHLARRGIATPDVALVEGLGGNHPRVGWPVRGGRVSIVIPTRDRVEVLRPCLESVLRRTAYPDLEIVLVDTGSREQRTGDFYARLAEEPRLRIVDAPEPFNYSAANNLGARHATGEFLLFLNNDIEVLEADWLEELVRWAERPEIGAVGAKLLFPDGRIQHAGVVLGMEGHAGHVFWGAPEGTTGPFGSTDWYRNYLAVTGACLMVRRDVFDRAGGFDEGYQIVFSDVELCIRLVAAGYRTLYTPFARLRHHEGASRGKQVLLHDMLRVYDHLADLVAAGDPFFSPNLSLVAVVPRPVGRGEGAAIDNLRRAITANGGILPPRPRAGTGSDRLWSVVRGARGQRWRPRRRPARAAGPPGPRRPDRGR